MIVYEVVQGDGPVILGMPHGGTVVPDNICDHLNDVGRALADTDWHIARLYEGLLPDATVVRSNIHRYVIDANRDPSGASLYPGQNTTDLCPITDFDGRPIYREGREPSPAEIARRRSLFHAPYHQALAREIERVKAAHGIAILFDCHSIRSRIPFLFEGELPALNIGTFQSRSCSPELERDVSEICSAASEYTFVLNGRFKGGWTTRHYGQPKARVHAIQLELGQRHYMREAPPWSYEIAQADRLRVVLARILRQLAENAASYRS